MRRIAQVAGIVWMVLCAALWLWAGLFTSEPEVGEWLPFILPRLLAESRFGLTFVPILLAIPGFALFQWGRARKH